MAARPLMCGHCYRPAVGNVYRRPLWRRATGLPATTVPCCDDCVSRYRRPGRWGHGW
jgi:hypothetical protein